MCLSVISHLMVYGLLFECLCALCVFVRVVIPFAYWECDSFVSYCVMLCGVCLFVCCVRLLLWFIALVRFVFDVLCEVVWCCFRCVACVCVCVVF